MFGSITTFKTKKLVIAKDGKTIVQVSQQAGISAEVGKGLFFLPDFRQMIQMAWSNPNSELVCALKDNVRVGPVLDTKTNICHDKILLKSRDHRNRISKTVLGYSFNQQRF